MESANQTADEHPTEYDLAWLRYVISSERGGLCSHYKNRPKERWSPMPDPNQTSDFLRGVEAMRFEAMRICREEMKHADSHAGDQRYNGRRDGAEACLLEISILDVTDGK